MRLKVKFICARPYDFYDSNNQHLVGCNCFVYDAMSNSILKVKVVNNSAVTNHKFGDDIEINAVIKGNTVRYEV